MNNKKEMKKAVALKYEAQDMKAPKVVAKGSGSTAEKIIEIAKKHGIHIHNDPELANLLYRLDLLTEIPPHLYTVVAEVFVFLYKLNKSKGQGEVIKDETLQDNGNR